VALIINPKDNTLAYTYRSESVTRKNGGGGACEKEERRKRSGSEGHQN
jgi:hypothetical protein